MEQDRGAEKVMGGAQGRLSEKRPRCSKGERLSDAGESIPVSGQELDMSEEEQGPE